MISQHDAKEVIFSGGEINHLFSFYGSVRSHVAKIQWVGGWVRSNENCFCYFLQAAMTFEFSQRVCLFRLILRSGRSYATLTRWVGEAWSNLDFLSYSVVSYHDVGVSCKFVCTSSCLHLEALESNPILELFLKARLFLLKVYANGC